MPHTHGLSLIWALLFVIPARLIWWADPTNRRAPLIYLAITFGLTIATWFVSRMQWLSD
jgi:hypothetical protein